MASKVDLNVVRRHDRAFVLQHGDEFELMEPRSVDGGFWRSMGGNFKRAFEQQAAMVGSQLGAGKKIAGEFILQSKIAPITSIGMPSGHKCVSVTLRNDAISTPYPIMFASADLERIVSALRESGDGLTGPRGSVFVMGHTEVRGTWPMRLPVLHAEIWMVLGNTNDIAHLILESAKAGLKTLKLVLDVYDINRKLAS